jgi:hypothetical protein
MTIWIPSDNAAKMGIKRLIAFAGNFLQPFDIQDSNFAVMIIDKPGLLQPSSDKRDATAMHSQHLRKEFLGKRKCSA